MRTFISQSTLTTASTCGLHSGTLLPVQGSPVWSNHLSPGVHQDVSLSDGFSVAPGCQSLSLFGRHTVQHRVQTSPGSQYQSNCSNLHAGRLHHKYTQVVPDTISGHGAHRGMSPDGPRVGVITTRQGHQVDRSSKIIQTGPSLNSPSLAGSAGGYGLYTADGPAGSPPHVLSYFYLSNVCFEYYNIYGCKSIISDMFTCEICARVFKKKGAFTCHLKSHITSE